MPKFECSAETQAKVAEFENIDQAWKTSIQDFENRYQNELEQLERLREERNSKLDAARHAIRQDAEEASIDDVKAFKVGPFSVQKKWSSFYNPEKLVSHLKDSGLYDLAISSCIIQEKVEVAKFEQVKTFLEHQKVSKRFETCEDGCELTPAISGPKPAVGFGGEKKDR